MPHSDKIICAAVWYNDNKERPHLPRNIKTGIVVGGWRHCNCLVTLSAMFPDQNLSNRDGDISQGFLTSEGMFVDRIEGGKIAFEANQIKELTDCLFSEDLY